MTISTRIDAPSKGTAKGRLSWLIRQLQDAPEDLAIEAKVARSQGSLAAPLRLVRTKPDELYPEAKKDIRQFVITSTRNMGLKRDAGRNSFIDSVVMTVKDFLPRRSAESPGLEGRSPKA